MLVPYLLLNGAAQMIERPMQAYPCRARRHPQLLGQGLAIEVVLDGKVQYAPIFLRDAAWLILLREVPTD